MFLIFLFQSSIVENRKLFIHNRNTLILGKVATSLSDLIYLLLLRYMNYKLLTIDERDLNFEYQERKKPNIHLSQVCDNTK